MRFDLLLNTNISGEKKFSSFLDARFAYVTRAEGASREQRADVGNSSRRIARGWTLYPPLRSP